MKTSDKESGKELEKEYGTPDELIIANARSYQQEKLEKANQPIRMRNLVRKRTKELEKKALEYFSVPSGSEEIAEKLYEYLSQSEKFSWDDECAMRDALITLIILPLNQNKKIVDAGIMRKVNRSNGTYFVPLLQDANLVDRTNEPKIIEVE